MGDSRSFGDQVPNKAHLVRGTGGVQGEVQDLRSDVDDGFAAMEAEVAGPTQSGANLPLDTLATATDTVEIGADVYEYVAALTATPTTPGNILVLHGADAAATLANIIATINGSGVSGAVASANGTANVVASEYNSDYLHIEPSVYPGGDPVIGDGPDVALEATLTSTDEWDHENLNVTGWAGGLKRVIDKITVTAVNLAADFDRVYPFVPKLATVHLVTDTAGVPDATGKGSDMPLTLVPARNAVTVDLNGGTTDPIATDIVYLEVQGW